jgi:hypothetical protein
MIHIDDYAKMLSGELEIVKQQTNGLTHSDSLLQPQPGGNCLNWVMGHLVVNLVDILKVICGELPADIPNLIHYGYGSDSIRCEEEGVLPLQVLLDTYRFLTEVVISQLSKMTADDFEEEIDF